MNVGPGRSVVSEYQVVYQLRISFVTSHVVMVCSPLPSFLAGPAVNTCDAPPISVPIGLLPHVYTAVFVNRLSYKAMLLQPGSSGHAPTQYKSLWRLIVFCSPSGLV